jgi:hypothetical protein
MPSPPPTAPPPPSNHTHIKNVTNITDTTDDPTNIYYPNANFITFRNGESNDQNEDNYSKYNGWSSPQQTSLARTNNMFSETPLPPPAGIASFNNHPYNQA